MISCIVVSSREIDLYNMSLSNIPINREITVGKSSMINPFRRDNAITAKVKSRKDKQEERRQKAQARGQKPIK